MNVAELLLKVKSEGITKAKTGLREVYEETKRTEKGFGSLGGAALKMGGVLAGVFSISKIMDFGGAIVSTTAEFQKLNGMLVSATGDKNLAAAYFKEIQQFAKTTPYDLQQVTNSFIKLKNLGLEPSMEALSSYGNTATAMGKSLDQMIEAVADASVGEFERLKEFGIKASKQGDKVKFTFQGITKEIKNSTDDIQKYLRSIGDVNFADAMEQQMNTINGKFSNLGDTWSKILNNIGSQNSGLIADVIDGIIGISEAIEVATDASRAAKINAISDTLFDLNEELTRLGEKKTGWFGETLDGKSKAMDIARVTKAIATLNEEIADLEFKEWSDNQLKLVAEQSAVIDKNAQKAKETLEDFKKAAEGLKDEFVEGHKNTKEFYAKLTILIDTFRNGGMTIETYNIILEKLKEKYVGVKTATDDVNSSTKSFSKTVTKLREDFLKGYKNASELNVKLRDLNKALKEGEITGVEYTQMQAAIIKKYSEANDKIYKNTDLTNTNIKTKKEAAKEAKNEADRLQSLLNTYDSSAAALDKYNKKLIDVNELHSKGLLTDKAYKKNLEEINLEYLKSIDGLTAVDKVMMGLRDNSEKYTDMMTDAFVEMSKTGKLSFEDLATSVINDMIRMMIQAQITKPFMDALTGGSSGGGGMMDFVVGLFSGGVSANAKGGVVNRTTPFMDGSQPSVMGEAGPEAILPLEKMAGGNLGVASSAGGGSNVNVNIINNTDSKITTRETNTSSGKQVEVTINAFKQEVQRGGMDDIFEKTFGIKRRGV